MESIAWHPRSVSRQAWLYLAVASAATLLIWLPPLWPLLILQSALLIWWAAAAASGQTPSLWQPAVPLAAVALWGALQAATQNSACSYETLRAVLFWAALAAAAYLCRQSLSARTAAALLNAAAAFAGVLAILGMAQFFTSRGDIFWLWPSGEPNVFGPFQSRNNFASFLLLFLPWHLWRALAANHLPSAFFASTSLAAAISSGSRAGAALALLETAAVLLLCRRRTGAARLAILTLCALSVGGWEILARKAADQNPLLYRREMMQTAAELALQRPLSGYGLGTFTTVYPAKARFDSGHFVNHAHNEWLQWAAEGGLPMAAALFALTLTAIYKTRHTPWAISLAAVALHALVDYPFVRFGLAIWIVTIAVAASLVPPKS